jgi:hypothetical protein
MATILLADFPLAVAAVAALPARSCLLAPGE